MVLFVMFCMVVLTFCNIHLEASEQGFDMTVCCAVQLQ